MSLYPIVVLPGLAGSRSEFDALAAHLTGARRVEIVLPFLDGDLTVDGQARQFTARIAAAGIDKCVLIGHSHGGLVALSLAAQRPDLVAGLVLLDTPVQLPPVVRLAARVLFAAVPDRLFQRGIRRFFAATFTDADPRAWQAAVMERLAGTPQAVIRAVVAGTFTYDSGTKLRALTVPALCVRANIPIRLDELPATVRGEQVLGVGHWPHVHSPETVNKILDAFLQTLPAKPLPIGRTPR